MSVTFSYHSIDANSLTPLIFSCFPSVDPMGDDYPGSGIKCVYTCDSRALSINYNSKHCLYPPYVCIFNLTQALHVNPYIAKAVKYVIQCFLLIDKIVALCHSQICLVIVSWGTNRIFPCAKHFAKMLGSMSLMQYFSVLWL